MGYGATSYYSNAVQRPVLNIRDSDRFRLDPEFLAKFEGQEPEWGPVGLFTFKRTYARPLSEDNLETEEFWQCLERIVNGVYTVQKAHCLRLGLPWLDSKAQRSAQIMFQLMWDFKFLPGGRGLWMMGTKYVEVHGSAALNNCLGYNTEIITADGIKKIGDCAGTVQTLLTRGGKWVDAPVRSFGHQKLMRVTLRRQGAEKEIYATPDHRWFAKDRRRAYRDKGHSEFTTENLRPEVHRLQYVFGQGIKGVKPSAFGIAHGIAFGDGTTIPGERNANCLYLCGEKDEQLAKYFSHCAVTDAPEVSDGGAIRVAGIPNSFRELPSIRENKAFLFGWLAGYLAADGNVSKSGQVSLSSSVRENILFVKDVCAVLGVGSYSISEQTRESNLTGRESTMYRLTLMRDTLSEDLFLVDNHRRNFAANSDAPSKYWTVSDVQKTNAVEEVFCATVDGYGAFALADNILTGNCAFVSTNEIDLAFAEPFCYLMDFSMLGVGVGSDCRGAGKVTIQQPVQGDDVHVVPDTREGWVELLFRFLEAYVGNGSLPKRVDYSKVRPYGALIRGFGGTASGPDPLIRLIEEVQRILNALIGQPITSGAIVDLCDLVGVCVVAGNVRRTAIIMFGEKDDQEFLNLKNPKVNSEAMKSHRWASNNSVFAEVGMDYTETAAIAAKAGEPGYMWMDNARKYGRMGELREDGRVLGFNPCAEISLESNELCVGGKTKIQTRGGVFPIAEIVGKKVDVWNGDSWSTVEPRLTGNGRDLYRVTLSDGSYLDCTNNHGWHVRPSGKKVYRRVEARDLNPGDKVVEFDISAPINGRHEPNAFEWGLFAGDGYIEKQADYPMVAICGDKAALKDLDVSGVWWKPQILEGYSDPYNRLCLRGLLTMEDATYINDKKLGLPQPVFNMDRESALQFVAGWIEADGTVAGKGTNAEGYRVYGAEPKMRALQILLRRIGVNHSTIRLFGEEGDVTNFGERNYDLWYCQIPSYECAEIPTRLKTIENIGSRYATNNAHPNGASIDRARKQKIVSVEKLSGRHTTYCFDEPENHMAVFGNVLTYQCNLVETFPSRHASYEEFERTLKFAYLYAKTVSLIPTHNPKTNMVTLRNRRIGVSQSGIIQSFKRHGRRRHFEWCDRGYAYIQKTDRLYSEWLCIRKSIKTTTVKPAGTTSLLPGVTPGIHYEHSEYYFRTVRIATISPLVEEYRNAGYRVEQDVYDKSGRTSVIYFPIKAELFERGKSDVSIWEQMENAAKLQKYWSDNSVSITVSFKPEESDDIQRCLELYESRLKTVSFLPLNDHGYEQAPYITIDEDTYNEASAKLRSTSFTGVGHDIDATPKYCDGDTCVIRRPATEQALP